MWDYKARRVCTNEYNTAEYNLLLESYGDSHIRSTTASVESSSPSLIFLLAAAAAAHIDVSIFWVYV